MELAGTILIVEDDPDDQFLLQLGFRTAGVQNPIHILSDPFLAMDYLSADGEYRNREAFPLPGLLITDYEMPLMNGIQLVQWVRDRDFDFPIVVLIGSGWRRELEQAYEAGATFASFKTSRVKALAGEIMEFWEHWSEHHPSR